MAARQSALNLVPNPWSREVYCVAPNGPVWCVRREGEAAALVSFPSKQAALDDAKRRAKAARPSQVKVWEADGGVEEEISYGLSSLQTRRLPA